MNDAIGQRIRAVVKQFHGKFSWSYLEPVNDRPPLYFIWRDDSKRQLQISEFVLWDLMEPQHETRSELYTHLKHLQDVPLEVFEKMPDLL